MGETLIVVADDNEYLVELMELRFAAERWRTVRATSGPEALRVAKTCCASMIVLDIEMPGGDGLETLERLKTDPRTANVPVIMLTGRRAAADVQTAARLGAVGYVAKPFDVEALVRRVHKHLAAAPAVAAPDDTLAI